MKTFLTQVLPVRLLGLALLGLTLTASKCGDDTDDAQPAVPTYQVRYTAVGISGNVNSQRPVPEIGFGPCHPNQRIAIPAGCTYNERLIDTRAIVLSPADSTETATVSLKQGVTADDVQGPLYLYARFNSINTLSPRRTSKIIVELLENGSPIQSISIDYNDAQKPENRYDLGNDQIDAIKFVRFSL